MVYTYEIIQLYYIVILLIIVSGNNMIYEDLPLRYAYNYIYDYL
jgi:hypothetical protein